MKKEKRGHALFLHFTSFGQHRKIAAGHFFHFLLISVAFFFLQVLSVQCQRILVLSSRINAHLRAQILAKNAAPISSLCSRFWRVSAAIKAEDNKQREGGRWRLSEKKKRKRKAGDKGRMRGRDG